MTTKDLDKLKAQGKIRGYCSTGKAAPKPPATTKKKGDKIKGWILLNLEHWCEANKLELEKEYMFDPERKWRFDWAIPKKKIAFEYEGLMSEKSRHTTISGFTGDTEKYNEAAAQGWRVIRYTAKNYKRLINDLERFQ
jgi:hypothetical protein